MAEWYVYALADDGKFTMEDADETIVAAGLLAGIWNEELFGLAGWSLRLPLGSMALAGVATVAVGTIPAYLIGGKEGVEDYMTTPNPLFFDNGLVNPKNLNNILRLLMSYITYTLNKVRI